jgi:predicted PolB exonuclease-like 3'-5' exonuclease
MSNTYYLVVDLETVPDLAAASLLVPNGKEMTSTELRQAIGIMYAREGQSPETAFIKNTLHKVVAIGLFELDEEGRAVEEPSALHLPDYTEAESLAFLDQMLRDPKTLVTFNGGGFDLPVLRYRALATGTPMPNLLSGAGPFGARRGAMDYFNRYGSAHIDLMERLSSFGATARPSLAEVLALIGEQAKDGVSGADVERLALEGDWARIGQYVRRDVEMTGKLLRAWLRACLPTPERRSPRMDRHRDDESSLRPTGERNDRGRGSSFDRDGERWDRGRPGRTRRRRDREE